MIIDDRELGTLTAICHMALGLERWFPNNNGPFAYGTRLCEEIGELIEVLVEIGHQKPTLEQQHHLVKETEDVLQIIIGVLHIYGLDTQFPDDFSLFLGGRMPKRPIQEYVTRLPIEAGRFADAINHAESQGIKDKKHTDSADIRLTTQARELITTLMHIIQIFDCLEQLEQQISEDYRTLRKRGLID